MQDATLRQTIKALRAVIRALCIAIGHSMSKCTCGGCDELTQAYEYVSGGE